MKQRTPAETIRYAKDSGAVILDLKFLDFPGTWQHFSVPIKALTVECFEDGFGFDGSSIRGWKSINESDMLVIPDPSTAFMDPFTREPTLSLVGNIFDPITRERYTRDPRAIAIKAENYLRSTGLADQVYFGPEAEFFIFEDVRFEQRENSGYYFVDSQEGSWNSGRDESPNLGYKPRYKEGYFPVPPTDSHHDLRTEMMLELMKLGIEVETQHHEVATAGQAEIDLKFGTLVYMADCLLTYKYVIRNVAKRHGRTVTFMPKPIFNDNGSGMHVHMSLWNGDKPLFAGNGYAGLSEMAMHYIGGILKHAPSLLAFTNPTTNSYRRLVPGFEAPVNLAYSQRNRSAAVRIPMYSHAPQSKRIEFRCPDPTCNPYLAFSAMLMAGLDGIEHKIDPGEPLDKNIYDLPPEELAQIRKTPGTLEAALTALGEDHDFLLKGDVFTDDVVRTWIEYKMEREVAEMALRPHPYEFYLYYDA
ncbi:MAG: type I glutamate--ammonia ligase [Candidatus Krumholzibacteriota bacterium]|nr:type I glutamate--ammonia ligase [Candidatus Krumholzibacteriota bacterium]